jgi:hypothetical protein
MNITEFHNTDGICRRRILLQKKTLSENLQRVIVELEDVQHGFRLQLDHDGRSICAIEGQPLRIPYTTCPQAAIQLTQLIGAALNADAVRSQSAPRDNCTHLYDMMLLAIEHTQRNEQQWQYDVVVPNEFGDYPWVEVYANQHLVHRWQIKRGEHFGDGIYFPEDLRGKPLFKGFYAWAKGHFNAEQLEAALVLQKGFLISPARNIDYDYSPGRLAGVDSSNTGTCYTYDPVRVDNAVLMEGTIRDFTNEEENLLKFL